MLVPEFIKEGSPPLKAKDIFAKTADTNSLTYPNGIHLKPRLLQSKSTSPASAVTRLVKSLTCITLMLFVGLKKSNSVWISPETDFSAFELDEIFWFVNTRRNHDYGINTFIMTMLSRFPRQIVGFAVDKSVNSKTIQSIVNSVPSARHYFTDGNFKYQDVDFLGRLHQNFYDKSDTHNVESSNADLRHYIAGLHRKSRCFFRSRENLQTILSVFIDAYNKFNDAKTRYDRVPPFSFLDFL